MNPQRRRGSKIYGTQECKTSSQFGVGFQWIIAEVKYWWRDKQGQYGGQQMTWWHAKSSAMNK